MGVALGEFEPHYWAFRDRYDRGCSDLEYWSAIGAELGVPVDESTSDTLTRIDIEGWSTLEPSTVELITALAIADKALALLSNAPVSFARHAEKQDWAKNFRVLLFSGDVGVAKPDPEIFKLLLERLDVPADECVFFDDRESNVEGARAAGLQAFQWRGRPAAF
ncbi:HAD-IA family hydrolase [Amycolatopsis sp. RM579]|uniref:HAD-IA family hydrolase n=2 Tax=Amycolatopsis pithecellobii TaxID=664692 RepID=A0A6N7Z138_9PSEU|nr:HAD-IA family hydrolase [Amycolatopsis pithecellobii]